MKRIFSILFALVLVLSFSLIPATSVMATGTTTTLSIPDNVYRPAPFDVSGTTTNDGTAYDNVRFNITVSGPEAFPVGTPRADIFTITYADDPLGIQGFNETFVLVDGDFVGYWGPPGGFPLPASYSATSTFTIQMNDGGTAPEGNYEVTVDLDDLNNGVLATATAGFSLSADTLYVGAGQQFTTIQAAVDAASAGDTIIVHPSTYTENVVVGKSVTIVSSDGAAVTTVDAVTGYGFTVTANGVTITGFRVIGRRALSDGDSGWQVGIQLSGVSDVTVNKNDISAFSVGVFLSGSNHNTIAQNTITNVSWAGIMLHEAGNTYNTITHNTIGPSGRDGIVIWHYGAVMRTSGPWAGYYACAPIDARGNVVMHNQVCNSNNWNIFIGSVEGTAGDPIVVAHNEVSGPAGTGQGIQATGMSKYVMIHHNTITDVRQAVLIWGEHNKVFQNQIALDGTGWDVGVNVKEHWSNFFDQSSDNFIHHNMVTNSADLPYYDQNDPGENRWLKNDADGPEGWLDPTYGTSWD